MTHYYHLCTDGEDTNLQRYALYQAKAYWKELQRDYELDGEDAAGERGQNFVGWAVPTRNMKLERLGV